jgi:hypothetical protein
VDDNAIAAVLILDTGETTIKHVHWFDGWVALVPDNRPGTSWQDGYIPTNYRADAIKILGKFVFSIRR